MSAQATLYDHVGGLLAELVPYFGLERRRATVERAYALLCRESLAFPRDGRPVRASRLNADGTPFEFSLAIGTRPPALQFLAETGRAEASGDERLASARAAVAALSELFGAGAALPGILECLDEMAPGDDPALMADGAGAAWLGAGFAPGRPPGLKLYVNARWGREERRWERLAAFAGRFGVAAAWEEVEVAARDDLAPLGVSLTVAAGVPAAGRIYLTGYGRPFGAYERLAARRGGSALERSIRRYGQLILGDDYRHPTRSVVCSFGIRGAAIEDFKLELCAHCAFDSDAEARERCLRWLHEQDASPAPYLDMLRLLDRGGRSGLHAYVGLGVGRDGPSSTFYFNPAAGAG